MNVDPISSLSFARHVDTTGSTPENSISTAVTSGFSPTLPSIPSIKATLGYLLPTLERPYNYAYQPPEGMPWENYQHDERAVSIRDARFAAARHSVHVEGFELWDAPSVVRDFKDRDKLVELYYPEVGELALLATGAARAYVFDHLVRRREPSRGPLGFGRPDQGAPPSANGRVHNDYTEESGRRRLALVLGEEAGKVLKQRYAIVNVWRSIKAPVLDTPLAVCDARTIDAADLVSAEVRYPRRVGDVYFALHSLSHRWHWFSAMDRHEALVFKQYDSRVSGVARYTPHAAFNNPDAPEGLPPRESIEARCLVVYD
ncbi:hypothetical protein bAD24_p00305 (plasmid) [Burkholderia sp. AD24]|nr:hypothetical protein bAD24_p00305 [Burkholderia sp. AD24]